MKTRILLALLSTALVMAACGGGSSSPAPTTSPPPPTGGPPPPPPPVLGGFWFGVLTFDMNQTSEIFVGLVTEDGRFRFLSGESMTQLVGNQLTDSGHVTGSGLGYADSGTTWLDGSTVVELSTDATLIEQDSFSGAWSTASGESGSFDFFYDSEYEKPSDLALLEGVWTSYDDFGIEAATFTIDSTGQFSGQNVSGCVSNGTFSIIDARYNIFQVESTISNCFIAGDYSGMALLSEFNVPNDVIVLSVSNDMRSILLGLEK